MLEGKIWQYKYEGADHDDPKINSFLSEVLFRRFAERHRFLINVYLKHRPQLLESSLAALLKYPRLIDFDAKREYFRGRMKTIQRTEGAHRGLRLRVRRDHLLDDSFRQMHAKYVLVSIF